MTPSNKEQASIATKSRRPKSDYRRVLAEATPEIVERVCVSLHKGWPDCMGKLGQMVAREEAERIYKAASSPAVVEDQNHPSP